MKILIWFSVVISIILYLFATPGIQMFLPEAEESAILQGRNYLRIVAIVYVLCYIGNAYVGYFRGVGMVMTPFWGTTLHLTFRVILSWLWVGKMGLAAVAYATAVGWVIVVVFHASNYWYSQKKEAK